MFSPLKIFYKILVLSWCLLTGEIFFFFLANFLFPESWGLWYREGANKSKAAIMR